MIPGDRPLRMQFRDWLRHQHVADEPLLQNTQWTHEECFTREGAFNIHNSRLWARDSPHAIRECGYQACFSVSVWLVSSGTSVLALVCYLPGWLLNDDVIFLKLFYRDCWNMCLYLLGTGCDFSTTELQRTTAKMYGSGWLYATYPEVGVDMEGRLHGLLGSRI
jgi:hypothetical protein